MACSYKINYNGIPAEGGESRWHTQSQEVAHQKKKKTQFKDLGTKYYLILDHWMYMYWQQKDNQYTWTFKQTACPIHPSLQHTPQRQAANKYSKNVAHAATARLQWGGILGGACNKIPSILTSSHHLTWKYSESACTCVCLYVCMLCCADTSCRGMSGKVQCL